MIPLTVGQRFCVVNLGCKVNRVEADTISARLLARGGVLASEEDADIIVVNTCTVTSEADKKARKAVRRALRNAPRARVIVTGCGVAVDPSAYEALDERVAVVDRIELLSGQGDELSGEPLRFGKDFRTRVNIKVQDGCDRACTYCIVHVARGPATSVPLSKVLADVEPYLSLGAKEIVLTGIDLGAYADERYSLSDVVERLLELSDRYGAPDEHPARVRASSLEPVTVDDRFIELLARSDGRLCRHVHLPLQSGSSKVLREMARPYSAEQFADLVAKLRAAVPSISITTDVIVGFPGESDEDFEQTLELARLCRFSKIHVFPYSIREGTPAAERADQVHETVKSERAAKLRSLSDELRKRDRLSRKGSVEMALIESDYALTESYHELDVVHGYRLGSLVPLVFD